jgi:hypothetical protein
MNAHVSPLRVASRPKTPTAAPTARTNPLAARSPQPLLRPLRDALRKHPGWIDRDL